MTLTPSILNGFTRFFLGNWIDQNLQTQEKPYYAIVFSVLVGSTIIIAFMEMISVLFTALYISHKLHNRMLDKVTHAKVVFFDSNPLGRIINRFSKDINFTDLSIPGIL